MVSQPRRKVSENECRIESTNEQMSSESEALRISQSFSILFICLPTPSFLAAVPQCTIQNCPQPVSCNEASILLSSNLKTNSLDLLVQANCSRSIAPFDFLNSSRNFHYISERNPYFFLTIIYEFKCSGPRNFGAMHIFE